MKAAYFNKYGTSEVIEIKDLAKPKPEPKEILVRVKATSINDWDWGVLRGKPFINKVLYGLQKPKINVLGGDVAGIVEEIGSEVHQFKVGDEVFGDLTPYKWGAFAEYTLAREKHLYHKPNNLSYEESACLPQAGVLAMQGLIDVLKIKPNEHLLINGAGGGVGSLAVQYAKLEQLHVTAVDKASKFEFMKNLGADACIDYQTDNFTENKRSYNAILDNCAHHSIFAYKRALRKGGTYGVIGGGGKELMQSLFLGPFISLFSSKNLGAVMHSPNKYLSLLKGLCEENKIKPCIDKIYKLDETAEALSYFGTGMMKGKIVISID
jgi:NADPH:quinone reductase-like Zn-dependent oxidoreductase